MDKIICLGGCGCDMTNYSESEREFPICADCFICPECGSPDPYGKAARKEICPTCRRELPNQKERIVNFHCDECGKTWKTQGSFLRRYKQRIEFIKKWLKENR
jgi:predicted RNA-binding Zn-ribbon protein involved in translation (DUF1610 family)